MNSRQVKCLKKKKMATFRKWPITFVNFNLLKIRKGLDKENSVSNEEETNIQQKSLFFFFFFFFYSD